MTTVPRQLLVFAVVLAALFTAGYAVGGVIEAEPPGGPEKTAGMR